MRSPFTLQFKALKFKELAKLALMGEKKHLAEARRLEALGLLDQAAQQSK